MTEVAADAPPHAPTPTLLDTLRQRLADAAGPLTLKELAKGLPKPKKVKAPEFEASLPGYLDEDLRTGRVFRYESGAKRSDRYWSRDEKHAIREAVTAAAATPMTVADLVKKAAGAVPKTDKGFAEGVVRDLIGEDTLFEHPPKKKGGQPLFGADRAPPPPPPPAERNDPEAVRVAVLNAAESPRPLAELIAEAVAATKAEKKFVAAEANKLVEAGELHRQGKAKNAPLGRDKPKPVHPLDAGPGKTAFGRLLAAVQKLLDSIPGLTATELLTRLRNGLEPPAADAGPTGQAESNPARDKPTDRPVSDVSQGSGPPGAVESLEQLVMSALERAGPGSVMEVAEVRRGVPEASRGREFDATVLRLANSGRLRLYADDDPLRLSPEERSLCVADAHGHVFKTIAKRN